LVKGGRPPRVLPCVGEFRAFRNEHMEHAGRETPARFPSLEPLWVIRKGAFTVSCVLRHYRAPGVEAQVLYDDDVRLARQFPTKADAIHWAEQLERAASRPELAGPCCTEGRGAPIQRNVPLLSDEGYAEV
jgi:hypothetical protein